MNYRVGDKVGGYEVTGVLGAGGMGEIYEVRNVISDRVEAMKVLLSDLRSEAELAERFMREIKLQARLRHENIAGLHTAFEADGQLIMIMELVDGETLSEQLVHKGLDIAGAVDAALQSLAALDYAHSQGVVHRDIKPSNIMVTGDGVVKIMDFGIAKAAKDKSLTRTGNLIGSLHYMSPEQVRGDADVDGRTDIYSLGVVLYEMVTGRKPFDGNSEFSIMKAHLEEAPVPPDEIDGSVDPELSDVILTAMAKDRKERYQRAGAFLADLKEVTSGASAVGRRAEPPISRPDSKPAIDPEITGYQRVSTGSRDNPPDEPVAAALPPVVREPKPASSSRSRLKTISGERPAPPPTPRDEPVVPPEPAVRSMFPKVAIGVGIAAAIGLGFLIPSWFSGDPSRPSETVEVAEKSPEAGSAVQPPPVESESGGVGSRPDNAGSARTPAPPRPAPEIRTAAPPPVTRRPPPASKPPPKSSVPPMPTEVASTPTAEPVPVVTESDPPPAATTSEPTPVSPVSTPPDVTPIPASTPDRVPTPQPAAPQPTVPQKAVPDPDRVYTIKEPGVSPPQMVHQVQPQYTAEARTNRTQGRVILQAEVWPDGLPHNIEILKSIGDAGLDQNAIAALRQWRFAAGGKDGQPVKVRIAVALSFRLM